MNFTRRTFLLGSGAIACLPGKAAPSNRVTVGVIGVGRQTVQVNLVEASGDAGRAGGSHLRCR